MFDIGTKELAETALAKSDLPLGPLNLHLSYNSGIAFGLGDTGPSWVVIASTTALTLALGVFAWSSTKQSARRNATALGLILGGAAANLVDRLYRLRMVAELQLRRRFNCRWSNCDSCTRQPPTQINLYFR